MMPAAHVDRLAISSIHGDPLNPRTWSGAPARIAEVLQRQGVDVHGIYTGSTRLGRLLLAAGYVGRGLGIPPSGEALARSAAARLAAAQRLERIVRHARIKHVLHMGTLDIAPDAWGADTRHYAYCDQTWALSLRYRPDAARYGARSTRSFEEQEHAALRGLTHVFTFGRYVRDHLISHYGLEPQRVTAIGSGMGPILPLVVPKSHAAPRLLFVAKHFFVAKGGELLLGAFERARRRIPDLTLSIVGDERSRKLVPKDPAIRFFGHVPLADLQGLYRESTLLVQPMLNDPWGQVYLEALVSRTPVVGLRRNGLPEICGDGRFGFLVDRVEPQALADMIVEALSDPDRLARMGAEGQRHVLEHYSWERVAERIAATIGAALPPPFHASHAGDKPTRNSATTASEALHHV